MILKLVRYNFCAIPISSPLSGGQTHCGNYLREFTLKQFWQPFHGINSFTKLDNRVDLTKYFCTLWTIFCTSNESCLTKSKICTEEWRQTVGWRHRTAKVAKHSIQIRCLHFEMMLRVSVANSADKSANCRFWRSVSR